MRPLEVNIAASLCVAHNKAAIRVSWSSEDAHWRSRWKNKSKREQWKQTEGKKKPQP
jgi:hypothetical protein